MTKENLKTLYVRQLTTTLNILINLDKKKILIMANFLCKVMYFMC